MALSKKCIETLLDLVEIKLSTIQIFDREDAREVAVLEACRDELAALARGGPAKAPKVVAMTQPRAKAAVAA